ncbi:MAG: iron-containing redox enzyme family protein [Thermoleophilaceae bacterium]
MSTLNAEARTVELPPARGALSEWLLAVLAGPPRAALATPPEVPAAEARRGEDFHLSLYVLYELHYGGFEGVDAGWEWEPSLLAVRRELERAFEAALEEDVGDAGSDPAGGRRGRAAGGGGRRRGRRVAPRPRGALGHAPGGPGDGRAPLGLPAQGGRSPLLDDPAAARRPKAALVEVQFDEYGAGDPARLHQTLYGETMDTLGPRSRDRAPTSTSSPA